MLRAALAVVLLLCASPVAARAAEACPGQELRPTAANSGAAARASLCLVNGIRAAHHLHALHESLPLAAVASSQVRTMVSWDYFADIRPTGQTPLSLIATTPYRTPHAEISVGQNIAWGSGSYSTPRHIVGEWMASPPHRAIILTAGYRDAGAAVKPALPGVLGAGSLGGTYAMEFAVRHY
jgi:uncharacterized protein YkwD